MFWGLWGRETVPEVSVGRIARFMLGVIASTLAPLTGAFRASTTRTLRVAQAASKAVKETAAISGRRRMRFLQVNDADQVAARGGCCWVGEQDDDDSEWRLISSHSAGKGYECC